MKIKFWGTRGSIPVSGPEKIKYGGNTTCYEIISECIPPDMLLTVDAGSGLFPLVNSRIGDIISGALKTQVTILTHPHWDHILGFTMAASSFIEKIHVKIIGAVEHGKGPKHVIETLFQPPYFPVHHRKVTSHMSFTGLDMIQTDVILVHPTGGLKVIDIAQFKGLIAKGNQIPFKPGQFPIEECLEITLYKSNHPEYTISYRLHERPTGRVAVVLTDNENHDGIPADFRRHLAGTNFLIGDVQYSRKRYDDKFNPTAGFGHGTPDYLVKLMLAMGIERGGFIHHDPTASDEEVEARVTEGRDWLEKHKDEYPESTLDPENIFALADYETIEV